MGTLAHDLFSMDDLELCLTRTQLPNSPKHVLTMAGVPNSPKHVLTVAGVLLRWVCSMSGTLWQTPLED